MYVINIDDPIGRIGISITTEALNLLKTGLVVWWWVNWREKNKIINYSINSSSKEYTCIFAGQWKLGQTMCFKMDSINWIHYGHFSLSIG